MARRKTGRKKTAGKSSAAKAKGKAGYDFIIRRLEKDKNAAYSDILKAAKTAGHTIYPIMFGRAKAALGLVKVSGRGESKARAKTSSGLRRGPGRPRKQSGSNGSAIATVISSMREQESENNRLGATFEKIRALLDSVL